MRGTLLIIAASLLMLRPAPGPAQPVGRGAAGGVPGGPTVPGLHDPPPWAGPEAPWEGPGQGNSLGLGAGMEHAGIHSAVAAERRTRMAQMRRSHWHEFDIDPYGNLVLRGTVAGIVGAPLALGAIQSAGFAISRQERLDGLDLVMAVFTVPHGLSLADALERLHRLDPAGAYDYDHVYFQSRDAAPAAVAGADVRSPGAPSDGTVPGPRVGLIDAGVEADHPALAGVKTIEHGCAGKAVPSSHGTAVASRLVDGLRGATATLPGPELYAADVYCGQPTGGSADAITDAVAWLVREQVPVINVSLVGPSNALLERVVEAATGRGFLIVAAVGNDGPSAPPLYPAAYPGVVAVTGVDRADKVLLEAGRGPFVSFAAPGADVQAASLPSGYARVRGTSFAAPFVAGRLARLVHRPDPAAAARAIASLSSAALDLGAPGRDPIYGNGCIGCRSPSPSGPTAAR